MCGQDRLDADAELLGFLRFDGHPPSGALLLPAGLDENESASFADDASACLHAYAKQRRLMTAVTDRRAPKCFLWNSG